MIQSKQAVISDLLLPSPAAPEVAEKIKAERNFLHFTRPHFTMMMVNFQYLEMSQHPPCNGTRT
jgi:hypothetical protein